MSQIAATHDNRGWAVFLDVDGTILEIAETPEGVYMPESLKILLNALCLRLDGALALVSGRSIADLDALTTPFRFCAAGVHGFERREASGCVQQAKMEPGALDPARRELARLVAQFPGLLLEDKGSALALHFRRVPHLQALVLERMEHVLAALGERFALQPGKCVFEIRPAGCTKATAISEFMEQPPFMGRTPLFVGDDVTDEHGFACVNELGGISIRVGGLAGTCAQYRIEDVAETLAWLRSIPPVVTKPLRPVVSADVATTGE
jgi:trehalose 6-phosphate phosphatase